MFEARLRHTGFVFFSAIQPTEIPPEIPLELSPEIHPGIPFEICPELHLEIHFESYPNCEIYSPGIGVCNNVCNDVCHNACNNV